MGTGVKQQEREANHSPPARADVKKTWIPTSILPYIFMVTHRDSFTVTLRNIDLRLLSISVVTFVGLKVRRSEIYYRKRRQNYRLVQTAAVRDVSRWLMQTKLVTTVVSGNLSWCERFSISAAANLSERLFSS
jgi:Na+/serine symporter